MAIFRLRKGVWTLSSKSDPRWSAAGEGFVGGGVMPEECEKKIKQLKKKYGKAPKDLKWSSHKY